MYAAGFGACNVVNSNSACYDLISSVPTQFYPFNCAVPAYNTLYVDFVPQWWLTTNPTCTTAQNPSSAYVTFRIRCQDGNTSEGCPGYGYYSDEVTLNYDPNTGFPSARFRLTGCGCDPG